MQGSWYYVNQYDTKICLNINENGVITTDLYSKSETKMEHKNHSYGKDMDFI